MRTKRARLCTALALGESRHPQAVQQLQAAWHDAQTPKDVRTVVRTRHRAAPDRARLRLLIGIIEHGSDMDAHIATDALSVYERNATLMAKDRQGTRARQKAWALNSNR